MTRVTFAAPVPVLAAIDGVRIGGALEFAASCDLRIATDGLDDRIAEWTARFDTVSRSAVARTEAMLNARLGDLVAAAMEREERTCVEPFDSPDARGALEAFADRRR